MIYPNLSSDIDEVVETECQIDPKFQTTRCFISLTAQEIYTRLCEQKMYRKGDFCLSCLNDILNRLGYTLKKVLKSKPLKKIPQTDAIFENVKQRHQEAKAEKGILRISIDTKATVKVGELSRNGYSRHKQAVQTTDHDQHWDTVLHPFGIQEIDNDQVSLYFGNSLATADFNMDCLERWYSERFESIKDYHTIMIDLDNGKANASNTGQFMIRMVEWAKKINKVIHLVYYPPYHSKYNRIERFWAILEKYWNRCVLNSVQNTIKIASNVKYKTKKITTLLINKTYEKTKPVAKKTLKLLSPFIERKIDIQKWDVIIRPAPL